MFSKVRILSMSSQLTFILQIMCIRITTATLATKYSMLKLLPENSKMSENWK